MPLLPPSIYFIQSRQSRLIKIGITTDLVQRFKALQHQSGDVLDLLVHVGGTSREERLIHREFAASRDHGEWFRPTPDILALVASLRARFTPEDLQSYDSLKAVVFGLWQCGQGMEALPQLPA